jgi:hypothetical protein
MLPSPAGGGGARLKHFQKLPLASGMVDRFEWEGMTDISCPFLPLKKKTEPRGAYRLVSRVETSSVYFTVNIN